MPLRTSDGIGTWIKDFKASNNPKFKGKSQEKRRDMAIAAYLSAKNESDASWKAAMNKNKLDKLSSNDKDKISKIRSMLAKEKKPEEKENYVSHAQRKAVWANRADGGKGHPDKAKKESVEEASKGLWANIHAKRARGEKMRKKGEKGAPTQDAIKSAQEDIERRADFQMTKKRMPDGKIKFVKKQKEPIEIGKGKYEQKENNDMIDEASGKPPFDAPYSKPTKMTFKQARAKVKKLAKKGMDSVKEYDDKGSGDAAGDADGQSYYDYKLKKVVFKPNKPKKQEEAVVNELSKEKLASYINKAVSDKKRTKGVAKAYSKFADKTTNEVKRIPGFVKPDGTRTSKPTKAELDKTPEFHAMRKRMKSEASDHHKVEIDHMGGKDSVAKKHGVTISKAKGSNPYAHHASGPKKNLQKYLKHHYDGDHDEAKANHPDVYK